MDFFGTLIAVFIGTGLISKEIERRSLYPLLAKPVSRAEFYLGKFAGLSFTLAVNLAVMAAALYLTLLLTGSGADLRLLAAIYPILLGLVLTVAFAMLFSAVASSASTAAVFTVGVVIAGRYADVVRNIREIAPGVPAWATELFYAVIPNFRNFDFKDRVAHGDPVPGAVLAWATVYAFAYVLAALGVGLASFRSRDFQ
jgi:ABC-type transport system involved in multi-copper enzyme maturation permease subunit